jgi:hypothetical protein
LIGSGDQLSDCGEYDLKFAVILFFQSVDPTGQMCILDERASHFNESADDVHAHADGNRRIEYRSKHDGAMLREYMRGIFDVLPFL